MNFRSLRGGARGNCPGSARDEFEELGVGLGLGEARDHGVGRLLDLLLHEGAAEEMDALEGLGVDEELLLTGAGGADVDGGPEAHLGALAVEDELHVAGALELLEDDVVHAAAGLDQHAGDDGERTGLLGAAGGGEELAGFLEGAHVEAAGAGAAGVLGGAPVSAPPGGLTAEASSRVSGVRFALAAACLLVVLAQMRPGKLHLLQKLSHLIFCLKMAFK